MRVLVVEPLDLGAVGMLRDAGLDVEERFGLQGRALAEALNGYHAILIRGATTLTAEILGSSPTLKVVARAGTGLDNVDVTAARALGIRVFNAPAANAVSVAELVIGLMIALERHLVAAAGDLREGRWEKSRYQGRELAGRTLGLVGFGRIGREVATRARAFAMEVRACDPLLSMWPGDYAWVRRVELDELLPEADFLSLHVPLSAETRGLVGTREIGLMQSQAALIQCARGGLVDEQALHRALVEGRLRGAALDVFAQEPPGNHPLLRLPNVVATPHLGASTREAQARAGREAAERVIEALSTLEV